MNITFPFMKIFSTVELMQELCKINKKYGMYFSFDTEEDFTLSELYQAAPYLQYENNEQAMCDGYGVMFFDSQEGCDEFYNMTVGDDGPTKSNKYDGDCRVYALTCDSNGVLLNSNT